MYDHKEFQKFIDEYEKSISNKLSTKPCLVFTEEMSDDLVKSLEKVAEK